MRILIETSKLTLKTALVLVLVFSFSLLDINIFDREVLAGGNCGQITVRWTASSGAERYELYRDDRSVYVGKDNFFTDSDLVFGRSYRYKVRAINRAGKSGFSNEVVFRADTVCSPEDPTGFVTHNFSCGGKIFVFWNRSPGAERYELKRGREVIYEGPLNYFFDSDLRTNRRYTYTVKAGNVGGWSEEVSVTGLSSDICPPPAPEDVFEEEKVLGTEGTAQISIRSSPRDGVNVTRGRDVASFDVEVRHSDMTIKRVDIFFSENPLRYLEEVRIRSGFWDSATLPINRDTVTVVDRGNEYRVRFSDISFKIPKDRTSALTVRVTPKDDVSDFDDISVYLKNGSIRMEDTLFIQHNIPTRGGGPEGDFFRIFNIR